MSAERRVVEIEWETPAWLFKDLDEEFGFTLDVCAEPWNAKVDNFYSARDDGLEQPWTGVCWMNPPYRDVDPWLSKAWCAAQLGATVVCLLPARTETSWWHEYVLGETELEQGADEIRFLRGRLTFAGAPERARFASVVVVFRPRVAGERRRPVVSAIDPNDPIWTPEQIAVAGVVLDGEVVREGA